MNKSLSARIMDLLQRRQLKGTLAKIALTISCVAIFLITYLLVAPVLTQEWETVCGMEEHVHTEECYTLVPADSAEAAEPTGAVKPAEPAEPAQGGHHHTDECYEEVPAEPGEGGHHHTDECYEEVIVEPAVEGHSHTSDCYEESSSLSCGMSEHSHSDGCLDEEGNQVCGMDEHSHSDSCYETSSELVCGQEETEGREAKTERQLICGQEETDGQEPATERRLVCGMEESDGAEETADETAEEPAGEDEAEEAGEADAEGQEPEMIRVLTCGKEEHVHSDQCYQKHEISGPEYICGFLTEHAHDDSCYFESGELKCTIPEHTHDDSCLPAQTLGGQNNHIGDGIFPEELPEGYQEANVFQPDGAIFAMTDEDGADQQGIQARVYMPENAFGTEVMFVPQPLDETDEAYAAFAAKLAETEDYDNLTAMDLGFVAADEESENYGNFLEPNTESGPVYVRLTVPMEISEETELAFWHYVNDGEEAAEGAAEKVTADFTYEDGVLTVDFAADSFSAFAITTRAQAAETVGSVRWSTAKAGSETITPTNSDGVSQWDISATDYRYLTVTVTINVATSTKITLPYTASGDAGRNGDAIQLNVNGISSDESWKVTPDTEKGNVVIEHTGSGNNSLDVEYKFDCWNVVSDEEFTIPYEIQQGTGAQVSVKKLKGKIRTGHSVSFEEYIKPGAIESDYSFNGFGGADKKTAYIQQWNSVYQTYFDVNKFDENYIYDIAPFVVKPGRQQPYSISGTFKPQNGGEAVGAIYMMASKKDPDALWFKVPLTPSENGSNFTVTTDQLKIDDRLAVVSNLSDKTDSKVYTLYFLVKYPKKGMGASISLNADLTLNHTGIDSGNTESVSQGVCLYDGEEEPGQRIYWTSYVKDTVKSATGLTALQNGSAATVELDADFFCLNEARKDRKNGDSYRLEAIIDLSYQTNGTFQQLSGDYRFSSFNLSLIDAEGSWSQDWDGGQSGRLGTPNVGWTKDKFDPDQAPDENIVVWGSTSLEGNAWTEIATIPAKDVWAINSDRGVKDGGDRTINDDYVRLKVVYNSHLTTALRVNYKMEIKSLPDKEVEEASLTCWSNYLAYLPDGGRDPKMAFSRYPVSDNGWDPIPGGKPVGILPNTLELVRQHDANHPYDQYGQPEEWGSQNGYSLRNFAKATLAKGGDAAGMLVTQALYDSSGNLIGDPKSITPSTDSLPSNSYSMQTEVYNVSEVVYSFSGAVTNGSSSLEDLEKHIGKAAEGSPYKSLKMRYYVLLPEGLKVNDNPDNGEKTDDGAPKYHFWTPGTMEYLSAVSAFYNNNSSKVVQEGNTDVPVSAANISGWKRLSSSGLLSEMYWEAAGAVTHNTALSDGQLVVFDRTLDGYAWDQFNLWGDSTFFWGRGLSFSAVPENGTGTLPAGDYEAKFYCQFLDENDNPISLGDFDVNNGDGAAEPSELGLDAKANKNTLMYVPVTFHNNSGRGESIGGINVSVGQSCGEYEGKDVVGLNGAYQYELQYQVTRGKPTSDVVLWCNVENYAGSEWNGVVTGVDLNLAPADTEVYVRTKVFDESQYLAYDDKDSLKNAQKGWLTNPEYGWEKVNLQDTTFDWAPVKAIAFSFEGKEFTADTGPVSVYIHMKATGDNVKTKPNQTYYKTQNTYIVTNVRKMDGGDTSPISWAEGPTTLYIALGYILPSTGGAGSATMCATGMALILAAMGLMYLTLRRSRKQREGGNV